jgi:hypothetical protein
LLGLSTLGQISLDEGDRLPDRQELVINGLDVSLPVFWVEFGLYYEIWPGSGPG